MPENQMNLENNEPGEEEVNPLPIVKKEQAPKPQPLNKPKAKSKAKPSVEPTGKFFVGEEDKRLMKKYNKYIVNKLGLSKSRSHKI